MTSRPRLLVVDDDPQIRRVLRVTLEALGFDVQQAADGRSALAFVAGSSPDLIVMDVSMPGIGGLELTR